MSEKGLCPKCSDRGFVIVPTGRSLSGTIECDWCYKFTRRIRPAEAPPAETKCGTCNGTGLVDDQNWTPDYPWDGKRELGDGLLVCGNCDDYRPPATTVPAESDGNLEMDAGAGASDYSHSLTFTSSKFIVTAFGHDREHCEDVLQCVLLGRFKNHEGDREFRREK